MRTRCWKNQKGNQNIPRKKWQWKHNSKPMGCNKSSTKRKADTSLPQETRETSNKWYNLTPKATRKKKNKKPHKVNRRKEIIKIRAKINEKEIKKN